MHARLLVRALFHASNPSPCSALTHSCVEGVEHRLKCHAANHLLWGDVEQLAGGSVLAAMIGTGEKRGDDAEEAKHRTVFG